MVESGRFYATVVDPVLKNMRIKAAEAVDPGLKILDVACGTGAQVFEFARKSEFVAGIDLSDSMIRKANKTKQQIKAANTRFYTGSALDLSMFDENEFDVSSMSLALHQFKPEEYKPILAGMKRISKQIMIIDYAVPLPQNFFGYGSKAAEFMAGREHNSNFKKYYRAGGLETILFANQLNVFHTETFARGIFRLTLCRV